jgi:DNA-binding NarL/FixJ family response regulator
MPTTGYAIAGALTPRMREVLRSAANGAAAKETAIELRLSVFTVNNIRAAAIVRLGARNIVHAVYIARERGDL